MADFLEEIIINIIIGVGVIRKRPFYNSHIDGFFLFCSVFAFFPERCVLKSHCFGYKLLYLTPSVLLCSRNKMIFRGKSFRTLEKDYTAAS